jgi:uncharacterized repeat protein (TIGR01451 family)
MKRTLCAAAVAIVVGAASQQAGAVTQEAKLTAGSLPALAQSGAAVAISGTTAVVGAPQEGGGVGAVYVFKKTLSVWGFEAKLVADEDPDLVDIQPGIPGDLFGTSVAIHGDEIAVGAPGHGGNNHGAVYTFTRDGSDWTQDPQILTGAGTAAGDRFGQSVSIESDTLAVGAPNEAVGTKLAQGSVYAYARPGGLWTIAANSGGAHIIERRGNARAGDHIGWSVSLSNGMILAGAPDDDQGNKVDKGTVRVYVRNGSVWSKSTVLNPGGGLAGDHVGFSVALTSSSAAVGAPGRSNNQGRAYSYTRSGNTLAGGNALPATGLVANDRFGASVAASGPFALIGAPQAVGSGNGKSYLFGADVFQTLLVGNDNASGDNSGSGNGFDSGRALIGAPGADATGTDSGAAYVFGVVQPTLTTVSDATDPSDAGVAYDVTVVVTCDPPSLACTPTGAVDIDDGDGASCQATLTPDVPNVGASGTCQLTSIAPGPHTVTASYSGTLLFGSSSNTTDHDVIGADVAVVKDDGTEGVVAGGTVTYTIVVSNPGDFAAAGVQVTDTIAANPGLSNASWTCTAQAGGTCPNPASGTGDLDQLVDLAVGGQVTFKFTADVAANLQVGTDFVDNTVDIVPPVGFNDLNDNNDHSTDTDDVVTDALFSDSFEGDPPP